MRSFHCCRYFVSNSWAALVAMKSKCLRFNFSARDSPALGLDVESTGVDYVIEQGVQGKL